MLGEQGVAEVNRKNWIILGLVFLAMQLGGCGGKDKDDDKSSKKDKDGKVHYGASVPAEYADQPYDILNSAGIVIEHVEDTTVPIDVIEEKKERGHSPF